MGSLVAELAEKLSSATNNFDIDEGTIYVNTSADTVGIGTTTPGSKLDVQGTMQVGVDDTGHDVKFFGATAGAYMLWDESQDDLIIGGAGRVGIGTTAPATRLHVFDASAGSISPDSLADTLVIENDDDAGISIYSGASSVGGIHFGDADDDDAGIIRYNHSNDSMQLGMGGVIRHTISSSGQLGIGTTSPSSNIGGGAALIHLVTDTNSANFSIESTEAGTSTGGFGINLYRNSASAADNDVMSNIRFIGKNDNGTPQDVTYSQMYSQIIDASDGTEDGALHIQTMASGSLTSTMSLVSGQVGIGTTAPDAPLEISISDATAYSASNTNLDPAAFDQLHLTNTSGTGVISGMVLQNRTSNASIARISLVHQGNNDGDLIFAFRDSSNASNSEERMRITSDGKVGIGSTAPSANGLTIKKSGTDNAEVHLLASGTGYAGVVMDASDGDASGGDYLFVYQANDLNAHYTLNSAAADHIFTTNGTEFFRVRSTGSLKINTSYYKVVTLSSGSQSSATYDAFTLDQNAMYEVIYTSQNYDNGASAAGWRYVRWHAYDGSGGGGDTAGDNWYITMVENSGSGETTHTPTWSVSGNSARITYGNGNMTSRMLTIRILANSGTTL